MGTLKDFSQALYVFHKNVGDSYKSIGQLCKGAREYFLQELKEVDDVAFLKACGNKKTLLIDKMSTLINRYNEIIKNESENDLEAPVKLFNELFLQNGAAQYKEMTSEISKGTNFYRLRKADGYTRYDRKGMFLISDANENLVGTYRFNPSGYACLYLASNLYLAWEECRRPDFDTFNFSRLVNTRDVEMLDLTIQNSFKFLGNFVMAYLTLLCCARAVDKDSHHFQYVVPQLLMKTLCLSQRKAKEQLRLHKNKEQQVKLIDGIRYLSSRRYEQEDFMFNDKSLSIAYVFPQHPHDNKYDICPILTRLFKLSEPRTHFLYRTHSVQFRTNTAWVRDYQDSLFYQLEELIQHDKLDRIK